MTRANRGWLIRLADWFLLRYVLRPTRDETPTGGGMNERNVEAMVKILGEHYDHDEDEITTAEDGAPCITMEAIHRSIARQLASRGVLVPSALTNSDIQMATKDCDWGRLPYSATGLASDLVRLALERIAKGEV